MFKGIKNKFLKAKKTADGIKKWMGMVAAIRPVHNFDKNKLPSAPDYNLMDNWAAHPSFKNNALSVPEGIEPAVESDLKADVFFIHPTTFFNKYYWNAPIEHPVPSELVDATILPGQASVFNSCCQVYAPRYRQATFYSFIDGWKNAQYALELAYQDVADAFDFFIKNRDNSRPFFIGSHSQGTVHAVRLLEEKIDKTKLFEKFVAAYAIGFQFPKIKFEKDFKNIKPCESPTDVGCVIAYDCYVEGANPISKLDRCEHFFSNDDGKWKWQKRTKYQPLCTNPLSWKSNFETVSEKENKGAVHTLLNVAGGFRMEDATGEEKMGVESKGISKPHLHEVSARCGEDGFLYISKPKNRVFRLNLLPKGNYHVHDYSLFYMNLRENVKERLDVFLKNKM